jgi:hypothetical protein
MKTKLVNTALPSRRENSVNRTRRSVLAFATATVLMGTLTGCIVDGPYHADVHSTVVVYDDYVYYPSYQVYYSSTRRQYVYLEGSAWVWRVSPPRVSVDVLFASPSISVDFHDAPSAHHASMIQTYPRDWTPAGHGNRGTVKAIDRADSKATSQAVHGGGNGNRERDNTIDRPNSNGSGKSIDNKDDKGSKGGRKEGHDEKKNKGKKGSK